MNEFVSLLLLGGPLAVVLAAYLFVTSRRLPREHPHELNVGGPEELVDGEQALQPEP
jgi:hypothetical protein